jgi:hypothetical protein
MIPCTLRFTGRLGLNERMVTNDLEWDNLDSDKSSSESQSPDQTSMNELTADVDTGTALCNYRAMQDNELTLHKGELLLVHSGSGNLAGWSYATNENQQTGLVQVAMITPLSISGELMGISTLAMPDTSHETPFSLGFETPEEQEELSRRISCIGTSKVISESTTDYASLVADGEIAGPSTLV